jgi:hypothetical protein
MITFTDDSGFLTYNQSALNNRRNRQPLDTLTKMHFGMNSYIIDIPAELREPGSWKQGLYGTNHDDSLFG